MVKPRWMLLSPILALACASCGKDEGDAPFPDAPIIIVSLDTVRADAVEGFGAPEGQTPRLKQFGDESIRFANAIASTHHTAPSHATILTGYSPTVHGVALSESGGKVYSIPEEVATLAETLKGAGYATAAFTDGIQIVEERGFDRGFDIFDKEFTHLEMKLGPIGEFLDEESGSSFFLLAHTYRAHGPYRAPTDLLPDLVAGYSGVFRVPALQLGNMSTPEFTDFISGNKGEETSLKVGALRKAMTSWRSKGREDLEFLRSIYCAGVTGADREFGALIDILKEEGVYEKSVIVVTSDHGEAFLEHKNAEGHKSIYDEVLRVPLMIRLPGGVGAGEVIDETFAHIHLMPTILALVGVDPVRRMEGKAEAKALMGEERVREEPAFSFFFVPGESDPLMTSVRTRRFKRFDVDVPEDQELPRRFEILSPVAFYNLTNDPQEQVNLAKAEPRELEILGRLLEGARKRWANTRALLGVGEPSTVGVGQKEQEAMRELGYLGDE